MEALDHNNATSLTGDNFTLGCRPFVSPNPCAHVVGNPSCEFNNIDYLRFYFCHEDVDDFPPALKQPVLVLWTVVLLTVRMREMKGRGNGAGRMVGHERAGRKDETRATCPRQSAASFFMPFIRLAPTTRPKCVGGRTFLFSCILFSHT